MILGAIEDVKVFGYQKRYDLEKRYTYILGNNVYI